MTLGKFQQVRECRDCGVEFESRLIRGSWLSRCPVCADIAQHRPTAVEDRQTLFALSPVRIESLPLGGQWQSFTGNEGDQESYVIDVDGSAFGASWNGRIVVRANRPYEIGDHVRVEEIESLHRVLGVSYTRRWLDDDNEVQEREVETSVPPWLEESGDLAAVTRRIETDLARRYGDNASAEDVRIDGRVLERHRYIRLSKPTLLEEAYAPLDADLPVLQWVSATYKTTLRGLGRQYAYRLDGSPLWAVRMSGSVRSGRKGGEAALCITDTAHPLSNVEVYNH